MEIEVKSFNCHGFFNTANNDNLRPVTLTTILYADGRVGRDLGCLSSSVDDSSGEIRCLNRFIAPFSNDEPPICPHAHPIRVYDK